MGNRFVLEVLNPRNAMKTEPCQGLTAPRVTTLDGIRIAIVSEKPDGCLYPAQLQKRLRERHPSTAEDIINGCIFRPAILPGRPKTYDTFIYGIRDMEPAIYAGAPVRRCRRSPASSNTIGSSARSMISCGRQRIS